MFSDNLIERTVALNELLSIGPMGAYYFAVALLALVAWRLSKWL